jgi:hypothetical protein
MNPGQRGAIAEAAIAFEATKLHVGVFRPLTESRYDLIFDTGSRLFRVQCKSAARNGDVVVIRCQSCRRSRDGYVRRAYTREEVDIVAAYCHDTGVSYLLQPDILRRALGAAVAPDSRQEQPAFASQLGCRLRVRGYTFSARGHSSAGRAPAWHAGGRRFEPGWLHFVAAASRSLTWTLYG